MCCLCLLYLFLFPPTPLAVDLFMCKKKKKKDLTIHIQICLPMVICFSLQQIDGLDACWLADKHFYEYNMKLSEMEPDELVTC